MKRFLLIHYGEIGLKGDNADYFVQKLRLFIKRRLEQKFRTNFKVVHVLGRFLIELPENFVEAEYVEVMRKVFGVKNFKFVYEGGIDLAELGEEIWANFPKNAQTNESFRVTVKRSMAMAYKSFEVEREIGAILLRNGFEKKVKMKGADFIVDVEFFNEHGYFSFQKYQGLGGMPANSQNKLVALLSAGIDSPVAAFSMMRRGARVILVHFHSYPYTDKKEMKQVEDLAGILAHYQEHSKLYMIGFTKIQKEIVAKVPGKYRVVLYRRMMLRIAEQIAKKEQAKGLVTGDSLGQVASQTPENIFTIHAATSIPLLQPLISFDKEDVIKIARNIHTYDISKLPCNDTCSMFTPKHPELKSNVRDAEEYEKTLDVEEMATEAFEKAEIISF